eukprot:5587052-Amphidinium_carterae.1
MPVLAVSRLETAFSSFRSDFDKVSAGFVLFMVYGRLRYNDLVNSERIMFDPTEGSPSYVEAVARSHKTAGVLNKQGE